MAVISNTRDLLLQATVPRLTSTAVTLSVSSSGFLKAKNTAAVAPSSITFTSIVVGFTAPTYTWYYAPSTSPGTFTVIGGASGSSYTLNNSTFLTHKGTGISVIYKCVVSQAGWTTAETVTTIDYSTQTNDAPIAVLSKPSIVLPATAAGVVDYTSSACNITVSIGGVNIPYALSGNNSYSVVVAIISGTITPGAATTTTTSTTNDTRSFADLSAMDASTSSAAITYTVTVRDVDGVSTVIVLGQSISKASNGQDGADGADATVYKLITPSAILRTQDNNSYSPAIITAAATVAVGSAAPAPYNGNYKVYLSSNSGSTYTLVQTTGGSGQSSLSYAIPVDSVATGGTAGNADPYFSNVVLQISGAGTSGSTTITDSSQYARTTNSVANKAVISNEQSIYGTTSVKSIATSEYDYAASSEFTRNSAVSQTIEFWMYATGVGSYFMGAAGSTYLSTTANADPSKFNLSYTNHGPNAAGATISAIPLNTWVHVAFSHATGEACKAYLNGVAAPVQQLNNPNSDLSAQPFSLVRIPGRADLASFKGYLAHVRITRGIARYPTAFAAPTSAYPDSVALPSTTELTNVKIELYAPGTNNIIDSEIIPITREGQYSIDLTNDSHLVTINSTGVASTYPTTEAQIFLGLTKQTTGWTFLWTATTGVTLDNYNTSTVTVTGLTQSGTATVVATKIDSSPVVTRTAVFTIGRVVDGVNSSVIDLSNSNQSVRINASGTVTSQLPTTSVTVYNGNQVDTGWTLSAAYSHISITGEFTSSLTTNPNIFTVTAFPEAAGLDGYVDISATKAGFNTLTARLTMVKTSNAVLYELSPSVAAVSKNTAGVSTPNVLTFNAFQIDGNNARTAFTGGTITLDAAEPGPTYYTLTPSSTTASSASYNIPNSTNIVNITGILKIDNAEVDRESVPIVSDGTPGTSANSLILNDKTAYGSSNSTVVKNSLTVGWNAQAYSVATFPSNVYASGRQYYPASFVGPDSVTYYPSSFNGVIGLNESPEVGSIFNRSIGVFGWLIATNTAKVFMEGSSGWIPDVNFGSVDPVFTVTYEGGNVKWFMDGVLKYEAVRAVGNTLHFDTSIFTPGCGFKDISFGAIGTQGQAGTNGTRTAVLDMYLWSATVPTLFPTGTASTYTWATSQFTNPGTTNGWTQTPGTGVAGQTLYIISQTYADNDTGTTSAVTWSANTPRPVGAYGSNGLNGSRTAFLEVYQWAATTPTGFPSGTSTYTWSTGSFTAPGTPNGWSLTPGASTPGYTLYACAVRYSDTNTTATTAVTWDTNVAYAVGGAGTDGDPGVNGTRTAVLDMYQWASSAPTLFPVGNSTYTWSTAQFTNPATPNGWTQTPGTGVAGQTLYIVSQAYADTATTTASSVTWAATGARVVGAYGSDGLNGSRTAFLEVYQWAATTPTLFPSGTSTYTWATGSFTAPGTPNSWSLTPGASTPGFNLYACSVRYSDTLTAATTAVTWNTSVAYVVGGAGNNGTNGTRTAVLDMYQWSATAPTLFPSGSSTYTWSTSQFTNPATVNSWTQTPGTGVAGQTLYIVSQAYADTATTTTSSVTWSATSARVVGAYGSNGLNGSRTAFLEVYQWAATTPTLFPSGTSTYTWATGSFTAPGTPNSWSLSPGASTPGFNLYACSVRYSDTLTAATTAVTWNTSTAYVVGTSGTNGTNGTNGTRTAVLDMYQWSATAPTLFPGGTASTYTWSTSQFTNPGTPNSWTQTPGTGAAGQTLYIVSQAYADTATTATSSVTWSATSARVVGVYGTSGLNGSRTAFLEVYRWASTTPTGFPSGTSTYTWATGAFTAPSTPNGWSLTPGTSSPGFNLYGCSVRYSDTLTAATTAVTWNTSTAYVVGAAGTNGTNGNPGAIGASNYRIYIAAATSTATPTTPGATIDGGTPASWSATPVALSGTQAQFQSDGVRAAGATLGTTNTTWGAPYLSYFKVASLSAITADLGTITAGSITGGSFRTASTGRRAELNVSSDNKLKFYDTNGSLWLNIGEGALTTDGCIINVAGATANNPTYFVGGAVNVVKIAAGAASPVANGLNVSTYTGRGIVVTETGSGGPEMPVNPMVDIQGARDGPALYVKNTQASTTLYANAHGARVYSRNGSVSSIISVSFLGGGYNFYAEANSNQASTTDAISGAHVQNSAGYGPFTGAHDGLLDKTYTSIIAGDILQDHEVVNRLAISDTITTVIPAIGNVAGIGVLVNRVPISSNWVPNGLLKNTYTNSNNETVRVPIDSFNNFVETHDLVIINSVGEGQINVCGENGDIQKDDLIIVSTTIAGKGMRQLDDIIRSRTIARARESVSFSNTTEFKQIACIYLCG